MKLNNQSSLFTDITDLVHPADTRLSERSEPPQRCLARVRVSRGATSSSRQRTGCSLRFSQTDATQQPG